jgi:hypothetical protein
MKTHGLLISFFSVLALLYSGSASSAGATAETQCYQLKNGKLINTFKCSYTNYANIHGQSFFWKLPNGAELSSGKGDSEWKSGTFINGKPTSSYIKMNGGNRMQCFKMLNKNEHLCGKFEEGVV